MNHKLPLSLIFSSLILAGCGGSSTSEPEPTIPKAIVPAPDLAPVNTTTVGVITGFGSVYINGVEYETDATDVGTDDNPGATESDLQVGMVVTLNGSVNGDGRTGQASKIHYSESLKGKLESIDLVASTLTILGQTVTFDDLTSFDKVTIDTLVPGDFLEISGLINANGDLYATRIEKEAPSTDFKLKGKVSALNTTDQTFKLGELTIKFASAQFENVTAATLADGQPVKVKGLVENLVEGVFTVATIKRLDDQQSSVQQHEEGEHNELEGFIDSFETTASFTVNGQSILTTSETEIEHGTIEGLVINARIKIKGSFDADNNLVADEIRIHQQTRLKLKGAIELIDQTASTVTVMGVKFLVSEHTKMKDKSDKEVRFFSIKDLNSGDLIELKGFIDNNGVHIATKLKRKQPKATDSNDVEQTELKGEVTDIADNGFSVMGVAVTTTQLTKFEDPQGDEVGQANFFEQLTAGMLVEVEGVMADGKLVASEVEVKVEHQDSDDNIRTEFRGKIEEFSATGLMISGHQISFGNLTEFEAGDSDLTKEQFLELVAVNDLVKVKGVITEDGTIIAKKIKLEIEQQAGVIQVELEGQATLRSEQELSIAGHKVVFNQHTELGDDMTPETFAALFSNEVLLEVDGLMRDNVIYAQAIEVVSSDEITLGKIAVEALIDQVTETGLVVAAHQVTFNSDTTFSFNGTELTNQEIAEHLSENVKVNVEGLLVTTSFEDGTAQEVIEAISVAIETENDEE